MSKIVGYRVLTINSSKNIPFLEQSINKYLNKGWTLYGNTLHYLEESVENFSQTLVKYSDSTFPTFYKYILLTYSGPEFNFERWVIELIKNSWTLYGYTWHTVDSYGIHYYSQALVQISFTLDML